MDDRPALTSELTHEGERDDALAASRAAGDHDSGLLVGPPSPLDSMHDVVVGIPLLVQQDEHLTALDLLGGHCKQLLRRTDGRPEKAVRGIRPACRREDLSEIRREVTTSLSGEEAAAGPGWQGEEIGDAVVGGVVEVCRAADCRRTLGDRCGEVDEVVHVALHLQRWVGHRTAVAGHDDEPVVVLEGMGLGPLLEFHHHVGGLTVVPDAGEHDIGTLARQGEAVLDEHLHPAESG